ncbi:MAG: transglutaminase family protein [Hyphomicrobiales bacterium]
MNIQSTGAALNMIVDIQVHLDYALEGCVDCMLQIEAAQREGQVVHSENLTCSETDYFSRTAAEDNQGERIWLQAEDKLVCDYRAHVEVKRPNTDISKLEQVSLKELPGEFVKYLLASRYCPADEFQNFVAAEFGDLSGGARIAAITEWINSSFSYVVGSSGPQTTALDTFVQRQGVCRDYAHLLVTLARASAIPARFASAYAPYVDPQDFHAVAEVYLDDGWHLVDATGMATPDQIAVIGVGRDAADVSFLTSYGAASLNAQSVFVLIEK